MKAIVCEMCSSNNLIKEDGVFVCQVCGTKYSVEEAKKLMVEIEGPVDVSGSVVKVEGVASNLSKARRAFEHIELGEVDKAEVMYEDILADDNDNFLANLGMACVKNIKQDGDRKVMYYLNKCIAASYKANDEEKSYIKKVVNYLSNDNKEETGGLPILVIAVVADDYEATKFLLENGADPNVKTRQGRKTGALFFSGFASYKGKPNALKIAEMLIRYGADTKAKTGDGFSVDGTDANGYGIVNDKLIIPSKEFQELCTRYS